MFSSLSMRKKKQTIAKHPNGSTGQMKKKKKKTLKNPISHFSELAQGPFQNTKKLLILIFRVKIDIPIIISLQTAVAWSH